jgi:hypothetical protein
MTWPSGLIYCPYSSHGSYWCDRDAGPGHACDRCVLGSTSFASVPGAGKSSARSMPSRLELTARLGLTGMDRVER